MDPGLQQEWPVFPRYLQLECRSVSRWNRMKLWPEVMLTWAPPGGVLALGEDSKVEANCQSIFTSSPLVSRRLPFHSLPLPSPAPFLPLFLASIVGELLSRLFYIFPSIPLQLPLPLFFYPYHLYIPSHNVRPDRLHYSLHRPEAGNVSTLLSPLASIFSGYKLFLTLTTPAPVFVRRSRSSSRPTTPNPSLLASSSPSPRALRALSSSSVAMAATTTPRSSRRLLKSVPLMVSRSCWSARMASSPPPLPVTSSASARPPVVSS